MPKKDKKTKSPRKPATTGGLSVLEQNILRAKGASDGQLAQLDRAGVRTRQDLVTVGDAETLAELMGGSTKVARAVLEWAKASVAATASIVVETADVVYCVHCRTRQPKDYKAGDLCPSCGKQAEPVLTCHWCNAAGPGKFCRQCGARFVPLGELELALLLKREGVPKDEIANKLATMSDVDKDALWARVRRPRA